MWNPSSSCPRHSMRFCPFFLKIYPTASCPAIPLRPFCYLTPAFCLFIHLVFLSWRISFVSFLPFLSVKPAEINDSEILIQWQGCRHDPSSRLSFFHVLQLSISLPRDSSGVFVTRFFHRPAKPKGSFFFGQSRYKERMKKARTLHKRLKW